MVLLTKLDFNLPIETVNLVFFKNIFCVDQPYVQIFWAHFWNLNTFTK